jgi:hypothetical protein
LTASEKSGGWNVVGSWSIEIPCIQENFGDGCQKCTLNIYISDDSRGRQIFAIFDFIIITGIMRSIGPRSSQIPEPISKRTRREKREEDSEEYEDEDEDEATDEAGDRNGFYFHNNITPSCSNAM